VTQLGPANCNDAELKTIFQELADMETGHKCRLEAVFVDIGLIAWPH
jgi:rubrerythrin